MARALRTVGLLGGMGPEATVLFMKRVIERTSAGDDRDHIPMIVDNNTQVPSRIAALIEGGGEDPGPTLAIMAKRLENAGAEALAMACNTAHFYAEAVRDAVKIPFLDMIELAAGSVASAEASPVVGVLASPAVQMTKLYDQAFTRRGITTLYPAHGDRMLAAIRGVKISSGDAASRETLRAAAEELAQAGATTLLVACSEFSIISDAISERHRVVDSIDVLADAVIEFSRRSSAEDGALAAVG